MKKSSGVLLHISSLPNNEGIGTFGKQAKLFVDFLVDAKQTYWQILPLNQTGLGDSPYQSFSTFAGNPYFIDLETLKNEGLLDENDYIDINWGSDVDYEKLYNLKYPILRKAVNAFHNKNDVIDYQRFVKNTDWLDDYACFMSIKKKFNDCALSSFPEDYRNREQFLLEDIRKSDEYRFWTTVQYFFYKQWFKLKEYANNKGIKIIGDCPIYVSGDSCDIWANPKLFMVNKNLKLEKVAGVPPDAFSSTGQLWGNPLYKWEAHRKEKYKWWKKRISHLCEIYDLVRIDHFRGLESFYAVDSKEKDATNGKWLKGPGNEFVDVIKEIADGQIIAEDLGLITDDVRKLLVYSGFPGMRVLEFGFTDEKIKDDPNMPENFVENILAYTGTHDNDTIIGFVEGLDEKRLAYFEKYIGYKKGDEYNWLFMKTLFDTIADVVIIQAQDLLGLDNSARMNMPGTIGSNWKWRLESDSLDNKICNSLKELTINSNRNN